MPLLAHQAAGLSLCLALPAPAGRVGRCLSKQVAEGGKLSPACKDLITVAAPRDARSFFDSSMSLDAVAAKVAQVGPWWLLLPAVLGAAGGNSMLRQVAARSQTLAGRGTRHPHARNLTAALALLPGACAFHLTSPPLQIAHSAGMSSTFVDPKGSGMGAVTITGWVAFLCLCSLVAVVVGIALFALQRAAVGRQHQYTRVMKQGDV
jgi:hypothetical protein